jgi:hypothetical protein
MLSATVSSDTAVPDHEVSKINDGDISSFWQSTGFNDTVTISLPAERTISRFEWEQDPNLGEQTNQASTNAPQNFTLDATVNLQEQNLVTGSGFIGTTFSDTFSSPVTAKDFTFEITGVQGQQEDANSIIVSEARLIESVNQTTPLTTVETVAVHRPEGTNNQSTKITYAADSDAVAKITADGIDANNDADFSERDFFSLWVFINDVSLLDTSFGNFKLGNNSETFYRWDFSGLTLQSGWNELKLQFKSADSRSEIEFQPGFQYNSNTGDSKVDFITADTTVTTSVDGSFSTRVEQAPGIRFFEIEFRGTKGSQSLEIILDDFRFIRNKFDDKCKFAPSLYLNNSEVFTIFLEGLDIATGTVEFWFQPH